MASVGLVGLAVMGQNLALNVAEKGFPISVYNRSGDKTDAAVARAQKEGARVCGGWGGREREGRARQEAARVAHAAIRAAHRARFFWVRFR